MSIRVLPEELQKEAEIQLNEVPSRVKKDIECIRKWLSLQHHLNSRMDDQWILSFLRGCKYNFHETKYKLDRNCAIKSYMARIYLPRDPFLPELQEVLRLGFVLPLLETDGPAGPRVIIIRPGVINSPRITFYDIVTVTMMIIDILLNEDDNFIIAGQHVLVDFKGTTMSHIGHTRVGLARAVIFSLQRAYPTRPQALHCVNTFSILDLASTFIQQYLNEKFKKKINFYSSRTSKKLHESISQVILPKEYGGLGTSLDELTDHWKNKVESYREWFFEDRQYRSDETERRGNNSFGKLQID